MNESPVFLNELLLCVSTVCGVFFFCFFFKGTETLHKLPELVSLYSGSIATPGIKDLSVMGNLLSSFVSRGNKRDSGCD